MDLFRNRLERNVDCDTESSLVDQAFAYSCDANDCLIAETLDTGDNGSIDQTLHTHGMFRGMFWGTALPQSDGEATVDRHPSTGASPSLIKSLWEAKSFCCAI
jgi:hypothetical protein